MEILSNYFGPLRLVDLIFLHSEQHVFLIFFQKFHSWFCLKKGFQKEENTEENEWSFVLLMLLFFSSLFLAEK